MADAKCARTVRFVERIAAHAVPINLIHTASRGFRHTPAVTIVIVSGCSSGADAVLCIVSICGGTIVKHITRGVILHARETILGGRALAEIFAGRLTRHRRNRRQVSPEVDPVLFRPRRTHVSRFDPVQSVIRGSQTAACRYVVGDAEHVAVGAHDA